MDEEREDTMTIKELGSLGKVYVVVALEPSSVEPVKAVQAYDDVVLADEKVQELVRVGYDARWYERDILHTNTSHSFAAGVL